MSEPVTNPYREQRLENLRNLENRGYPPYGRAFERTGRLDVLRRDFADDREVRAAGRISAIRSMGKTVFADLSDGSGRLQLFVNRGTLGEAAFDAFGLLDIGDHIGIDGRMFTTRMGEPSIRVTDWTLLAKTLLPLPEKWHGLRDTEARYRQRYLDLLANPEVRRRFDLRAAMMSEIRGFLHARGYQEVETPMLQACAGGAAARPFITHYSALDARMALRIAPELFLKRLLVGGFDRVFELNRNFRNEGLDRTHNPEFTMLELYEAYADLKVMRELIQSLITHLAEAVFGGLVFGEEDSRIDLTPPWREVTYSELISAYMGADWFTIEDAVARERALADGLDIGNDFNHMQITHEVYEKRIEKQLVQPTFVTRLPAALVPLARACPDDAEYADVFELVIAGQEIAPAYTELNDPREQRLRFEAQAGAERERIDEDFLTALEHGMPPAGGMGVGIDRLAMILSGVEAIRDVILFPQLRPKSEKRP